MTKDPEISSLYDSKLCISLAMGMKNDLLSLYKSGCISTEFHPYNEIFSTDKKVNDNG